MRSVNLEHRVWRRPILPEPIELPTLTRIERRARAAWRLLRQCSRIAQLLWEDQPLTGKATQRRLKGFVSSSYSRGNSGFSTAEMINMPFALYAQIAQIAQISQG